MGVVVGLQLVAASPDERCQQFIDCLYDRIYGEGERQVDLSAPELPFVASDIDFEEAKRRVAEAAAECDQNWHELYGFPRDSAS